jgi:hypothetical protein
MCDRVNRMVSDYEICDPGEESYYFLTEESIAT